MPEALPPVDPNVRVPPIVTRLAALADAAHKQAYGEPQPDPNASPPTPELAPAPAAAPEPAPAKMAKPAQGSGRVFTFGYRRSPVAELVRIAKEPVTLPRLEAELVGLRNLVAVILADIRLRERRLADLQVAVDVV